MPLQNFYGSVAQMVEQVVEDHRVGGSLPSGATTLSIFAWMLQDLRWRISQIILNLY